MVGRNQSVQQEQPLAENEAIEETENYSEADSENGDPISRQDFRVYQLETRFARSEKLRQY